ncbi:MAG: hypothetical protein QNI84_08800 [Henriciella sp.]|nr:hypothetical protein [Henriciella sp.]
MKKKSLPIGAAAAAMLALTGCIHVDEAHHSNLDEIAINTETALRICGEGFVKQVDDDGFECKDDD